MKHWYAQFIRTSLRTSERKFIWRRVDHCPDEAFRSKHYVWVLCSEVSPRFRSRRKRGVPVR